MRTKRNFTCLNGQRKTDEIENQNFILMKSDEAVSQRDWTCDREGGSSENESETTCLCQGGISLGTERRMN
jgi:hypothetical protein